MKEKYKKYMKISGKKINRNLGNKNSLKSTKSKVENHSS
jgi:hypothetical protein